MSKVARVGMVRALRLAEKGQRKARAAKRAAWRGKGAREKRDAECAVRLRAALTGEEQVALDMIEESTGQRVTAEGPRSDGDHPCFTLELPWALDPRLVPRDSSQAMTVLVEKFKLAFGGPWYSGLRVEPVEAGHVMRARLWRSTLC